MSFQKEKGKKWTEKSIRNLKGEKENLVIPNWLCTDQILLYIHKRLGFYYKYRNLPTKYINNK